MPGRTEAATPEIHKKETGKTGLRCIALAG